VAKIRIYPAPLILICLLVYLAVQLRTRIQALRRRTSLERVLAKTSRRLLETYPQKVGAEIEEGLADIACCLGADRAYFIRSDFSERLYTWSGSEVKFPPGWPGGARSLVSSLAPTPDNIFQVPRADRLASKEAREACMAFGLKGFACALNTNVDGAWAILGIDAVRGPCRFKRLEELSLLSLALETFVNSTHRFPAERERARLEQRLQEARRNETAYALAGGVAHNFNNIMESILGYAEMMDPSAASPSGDTVRNLAGIRRACERGRDLVECILKFSCGREDRRQPVDVRALLVEATSVFGVWLPRTIELAICECAEAVLVELDATQFQRAIFNLCTNAAHAMGGVGRVEVEMQVIDVCAARTLSHGKLNPGRYCCIRVIDSGCGMNKSTLECIFDPCFTTRANGNGLGLLTVYELAHEYGGAINVESEEGIGSRFEVWLRRAPVKEQRNPRDGQRVSGGNGETVLIIVDELEARLHAEEILAALGYEPIGFDSVDDAFVAYGTLRHFDAILVFNFTWTSAGVECAGRLHKLAPRTPIVLATWSVYDVSAQELAIAGVSEIVSWPLVASEIAAAMSRCFVT
jgi:signal transduction histidine kinase